MDHGVADIIMVDPTGATVAMEVDTLTEAGMVIITAKFSWILSLSFFDKLWKTIDNICN